MSAQISIRAITWCKRLLLSYPLSLQFSKVISGLRFSASTTWKRLASKILATTTTTSFIGGCCRIRIRSYVHCTWNLIVSNLPKRVLELRRWSLSTQELKLLSELSWVTRNLRWKNASKQWWKNAIKGFRRQRETKSWRKLMKALAAQVVVSVLLLQSQARQPRSKSQSRRLKSRRSRSYNLLM